MKIETPILHMEHYIKNAEAIKSLVIERMIKENMISKEQGEEFLSKWQVVMVKRKWYHWWWNKFFRKDPDCADDVEGNEFQYRLVKFED